MAATTTNHILFGTSKLLQESRPPNSQRKILRLRICCFKASMSKMYKLERYVFNYFVKKFKYEKNTGNHGAHYFLYCRNMPDVCTNENERSRTANIFV